MYTSQTFNTIHQEATKVQFKEDWNNGTGYFDNVGEDETINNLPAGLYSFHTGEVNNRKGIIVKNNHGETYVIHERYTYDESSEYSQVYVSTSVTNKEDISHRSVTKLLQEKTAEELKELLAEEPAKVLEAMYNQH